MRLRAYFPLPGAQVAHGAHVEGIEEDLLLRCTIGIGIGIGGDGFHVTIAI